MEEVMQEMVPEAVATLKYARISPRKVKIVADLLRGKNVDEALAIVKFTPKAASEIIEKVLKSHVSLSNRFEKAICQLWRKEGFTSKQILDTAIASLILPKVNISSAGTDIDIDSIYEELKVIFNNKTISKQVLEYMHSSDELTYWR